MGWLKKRLSFECCWKLVQLITILNYIGTHYKHLAYCRVFYSGHWHRLSTHEKLIEFTFEFEKLCLIAHSWPRKKA